MDSEEPYLRPCKQLPSPSNDRQASILSMGQHLGTQSSSQGLVGQDSRESSQEPSSSHEDLEDNTSHSEEELSIDKSAHGTSESPIEKMARHLKGKERDWAIATKKEGPLQLLDLPLDVLKIILKEVTHTNDLANCAKVNSALHSIVTPMIYSRFDIVWPDSLSSAEPRAGVDALTYGLATLVMREDLFENFRLENSTFCPVYCQSYACSHCGLVNYVNPDGNDNSRPRRSRRGNYFSQFVKKFSLGNGPVDWVQEYLVTKESGKMLGTLVALSIARMPNLESFVWDMPTGVLRDIWTALSSLGDHRPSKLEKLWIRFHDNQAALHDAGLIGSSTGPQASQPPSAPGAASQSSLQASLMDPERYGVKKIVWTDHHVEKPNFSIIPPLRSLTVLDIDEVRYLVELSVLLRRSLSTLRELRLGLASTIYIPPSSQNDIDTAPLFSGGALSLLMSKIYDHSRASNATKLEPTNDEKHAEETSKQSGAETSAEQGVPAPTTATSALSMDASKFSNVPGFNPDTSFDGPVYAAPEINLNVIDPDLFPEGAPENDILPEPETAWAQLAAAYFGPIPPQDEDRAGTPIEPHSVRELSIRGPTTLPELPNPASRLKLEVFEVERITKLIPRVLHKAIDFSLMTSLTLLQCGDQSSLWDLLKREYSPRKSLLVSLPSPAPKSSDHKPQLRRKPSTESLSKSIEYRLRLKKLHTDAVSSELISFLKTTLAPNSLEWMFLQDSEIFVSPVTLEAIYRGPLRRHRASLTKLMIDSAYGASSSRSRATAARKWMLNREVLTFVTSGKMSKLRELAMAVEYKDWHFFLQRLPNVPHLRSLYIPNIADHPYGSQLNVKDFALSAIDVVALRPEVELCYLGIKNKCFEILETKHKNKSNKNQASTTTETAEDSDDDDTQDEDHNEDDDDSDGDGPAPAAPADDEPAMDPDADGNSSTTDDEDDANAMGTKKIKLKLREILFYDDKISIFKARHGRL